MAGRDVQGTSVELCGSHGHVCQLEEISQQRRRMGEARKQTGRQNRRARSSRRIASGLVDRLADRRGEEMSGW